MHIGIHVVEGAFSAGVTALLDVLAIAAARAPAVAPGMPELRLSVLASAPQVRLSSGVTLERDADLRAAEDVDLLVVAALGALDEQQLRDVLVRADVRELITTLRDLEHPRLAAACTGTFALGDAGRLDGGRATTTWWLGGAFRRRFPHVDLAEDDMVVRAPQALTAGAAFAHVDLALAIVHDLSPALADHVARMLVLDRRASQAAFSAVSHIAHSDTVVTAFERWARANLGRPVEIEEAADALGVTRRTLERRTRAAIGRSPAQLLQRLRLERAQQLLTTTDRPLTQVAAEVGYGSASSLRRALTRAGL